MCVLFYLGDLDPSGEDMVRDIEDRLELMRANFEVRKLAIDLDQVAQYNPPPNPVKMTDSRARGDNASFRQVKGDDPPWPGPSTP